MGKWVLSMIEGGGYAGIVLLMFVENVFPPIPSELIMPMAGYLAEQDRLSMPWVVAAGTLGAVLGALPLYWIGRRYGMQRLCDFAGRHGRWLTMSPQHVERADHWFSRHGWAAVLLCRLVPGLRSLISIPAGVHRMPMASFLFFTVLGSAAWSALLAYAGFLLGRNFRQVGQWIDPIAWVVVGAIVALYVYRVATHKGAGGEAAG